MASHGDETQQTPISITGSAPAKTHMHVMLTVREANHGRRYCVCMMGAKHRAEILGSKRNLKVKWGSVSFPLQNLLGFPSNNPVIFKNK